MTAATEPGQRIATLDIVRGVAVMGILAMNIVAFAMPISAYFNPLAYGAEAPIDFGVYAFNFVLIDGKMRGLFSFLFGASMLLVINRAEARGESPAAVHYRRMLVLLLFGALHFYFIWFGDILFSYALIGMIAYSFRQMGVKALIGWGVAFIIVQFLMMAGSAWSAHGLAAAAAQPGASADIVRSWREMSEWVRVPTPAELQQQMALMLGPWSGIAHAQLTEHRWDPLVFSTMFGSETLGYMLFGMAALKSGFLTGEWDDGRYRRVALRCFLIGIPAYCALLYNIFNDQFSGPSLFTWSIAATVPLRPIMIVAIAATIILVTRRGGWLTQRIAAAGRAAFTNYLGTSILMTFTFYGWGLGLFGTLSRAELWLVVIAMWALMLAWSKPWLDRYRFGPFEWLWRSLSRGEVQPMRKGPLAPA